MATPTDFAILAMLQSLLGPGNTAKEERFLLNEVARRLILSGLAISPTGVFSFTVPFLDPSAIIGTVGVTKGGTGLSTIAINRMLYASAADVLTALPTANSAILQTGVTGIPAWSASLPSGITLTAPVFSGSIGSDLLFTDNTFDIGKSAATRPRDLWLSRNLDVQGTLNVVGATTLKGAVDVGDNVADVVRIIGTVGNDLIFTDATYDIGKSAATRPRDGFFSRNLVIGGTLGVTGISSLAATTVSTTLAVTGATTLSSTLITPKIMAGPAQGRLTLTSGTPVTTADVASSTSVYWTPLGGNAIGLYDGSTSWTLMSFVETALALGTITNDLPYDVFAFNNSGTLGLEILAWTSKTVRATALVLQDGVLSKSGSLTRRYLGTFHTTSTTTTADTATRRLLWNYYNRDRRQFLKQDAGVSYAYTTATWRQAHADAANQVDMVIGWAEANLHLFNSAVVNNATDACAMQVSIGKGSTTTPIVGVLNGVIMSSGAVGSYLPVQCMWEEKPVVGYQFYAMLECSAAVGSTTWRLSTTFTSGAMNLAGMNGWIEG